MISRTLLSLFVAAALSVAIFAIIARSNYYSLLPAEYNILERIAKPSPKRAPQPLPEPIVVDSLALDSVGMERVDSLKELEIK